MADSKISALTAASAAAAANEFAVNESGTSKKVTLQQVADFLFTRINGSSGAAGTYKTLQKLSSDSSDNTSATPAVVMTTTGVGAGTWHFKYNVIYQTAATTTGIGFCVNHTGTAGQFSTIWWQVTTGGSASTGVGDGATTGAAQMMEGKSERVINTASSTSSGVDTQDADIHACLEGIVVVSVSGSLELKINTEVATSAVRIMADSVLELTKIG